MGQGQQKAAGEFRALEGTSDWSYSVGIVPPARQHAKNVFEAIWDVCEEQLFIPSPDMQERPG